jgi:hypothetical protein
MIRKCEEGDFEAICKIVNNASEKYRGAIPEDRRKEPYLPTGADRNLGCRGMGGPVLRKARVQKGVQRGKGPPSEEILVHPGAAGGNFRGPCRSEMVQDVTPAISTLKAF